MFETIPQAIVQGLLLSQIFYDRRILDSANIQDSDVYTSVISAILNAMVQVLRLRSESNACNETFYQYSVSCLMARILWIPFIGDIEKYLSGDRDGDNDNKNDNGYVSVGMPQVVVSSGGSVNEEAKDSGDHLISYKIKCDYPFGISNLVDHKHDMTFNFSSLTINELISTFDLSKGKNDRKNEKNNSIKNKKIQQGQLRINFGKSLRYIIFINYTIH